MGLILCVFLTLLIHFLHYDVIFSSALSIDVIFFTSALSIVLILSTF